jgi:hypothetical protein
MYSTPCLRQPSGYLRSRSRPPPNRRPPRPRRPNRPAWTACRRRRARRWSRSCAHFTVTSVALLPPPAPPPAPRPAAHHKHRPPPREVPAEAQARAQELGWTPEHLAELAGLLRPGDTLGEVTAQSIEIRRRSGVAQKFYNPDAPQPWKRLVETNREEKTKHA